MARDGWFGRRSQAQKNLEQVPEGLWTKCPECSAILFAPELEKNLKVCPRCGHHYRLNWQERLDITVDSGTFVEFDGGVTSVDPLGFPDYESKLEKGRRNTGLEESIVTGRAAIGGCDTVIGIADFAFIGGSMASATGEKIVRAIERAVELGLPVVLITASGGARMFEGLLALMQMAKTAAACARLKSAGLPYIVVFTDPTMAGVHASYASIGDIIISEPKALVGLAGQRVAAQAQVAKVPANFQRAEFQLEHGMIDMIVPRRELRDTLGKILKWSTSEVPVGR
ncbi:MAG: acetyl-CoA carboxylase carboxyltransferase subunit beta [Armatimonadetes bacterium]|nr:acetyl-CoA carboxylase carboxyltransferase subunit beta [Armatimonadota bacterium]